MNAQNENDDEKDEALSVGSEETVGTNESATAGLIEYPIEKILPADFPFLLKQISDPPKHLYIRGKLPPADYVTLCVVGSRKNTEYGRMVTSYLIKGLEQYKVAIISGLAYGIDSLAHQVALECNLPTIAVPGSGLDPETIYPRLHRGLSEEIVASGGALISEFEHNEKARPWFFPQRNRIMAGLCTATLLIEAEQQSGTQITARQALDYNRDVFVVPGSIFSSHSTGVHALAKDGAQLISSPEEIIEALHLEKKDEYNLFTSMPDETQNISEEILKHLVRPKTAMKLSQLLSIPVNEIHTTLSLLEIQKKIFIRDGLVHKVRYFDS